MGGLSQLLECFKLNFWLFLKLILYSIELSKIRKQSRKSYWLRWFLIENCVAIKRLKLWSQLKIENLWLKLKKNDKITNKYSNFCKLNWKRWEEKVFNFRWKPFSDYCKCNYARFPRAQFCHNNYSFIHRI